MPLSGSGKKAERSASAPSLASERGGLAERAVEEEQQAGWAWGEEWGHSAVESSLGFGAALELPPSVTAVKTVGWKGGLWLGHWLWAASRGAVAVGYVSWRRSAQEALWKGRTAAGSVFVQ